MQKVTGHHWAQSEICKREADLAPAINKAGFLTGKTKPAILWFFFCLFVFDVFKLSHTQYCLHSFQL